MSNLSNVEPGRLCKVLWIVNLPELMEQFRKMHLLEGSLIRVVSQSPLGTIINVDGRRYIFGSEVGFCIKVQPVTA